MMNVKSVISGIIVFLSAAIFFSSWLCAMDPAAVRTAAVAVFVFGFWSTSVLPSYLTALLFFLAATIGLDAPAAVVFSGFHSSAFWLVFGGLVIGAAVKETGLGSHLARNLTGMLSDSYLFALTLIVFGSFCFAFLIPSTTGRVVLLIPIVVAVSDRLGFPMESNGRQGVIMAAILACFAPTCAILPANVANMILSGSSENIYGLTFHYGEYFLWHFPVVGLMKAASIIIVARVLFPDQITAIRKEPLALIDQKSDPPERRLLYIIAGTLLFWATDFLHGISPAWVALAAGILCLLPISGVLSAGEFKKKIDFGLLLYVAGVLGIGSLVAHSGLGQIIGEKLLLLAGFEKGQSFQNFIRLIGIHVFLSPVTTVTGLPAIMTPLSQKIAIATGFPLKTVIMSQVIGYSTILFPYQVPPIIVGMQMGGVSMAKGIKMTVALAVVSILFLIPANYLWWGLLGAFN